jgi:hypothetical protein
VTVVAHWRPFALSLSKGRQARPFALRFYVEGSRSTTVPPGQGFDKLSPNGSRLAITGAVSRNAREQENEP